jgi:hypothetical protein
MALKKKKPKKAKTKKAAVKHGNAKKKTAAKKKVASKRRAAPKRKVVRKRPARRVRGRAGNAELLTLDHPGLGAGTGGQSGDTQGLSDVAETDSESVQELLEEGQSFEAEVVSGVENARDPDESEVVTRQVPEDDVPEEYVEGDDDGPERNSRVN